MFLCYVDESGTSAIPGNTSHFVLAGLSIPISEWKSCENEINKIKKKYELQSAEIHTGWILRPYSEQNAINNFDQKNYAERKNEVLKIRKEKFYTSKIPDKQVQKNYKNTENYVHLTFIERQNFIKDVAEIVSNWKEAKLFADCIDKIHFDPTKAKKTIDEETFEQIISRFELFLKSQKKYGLLIHDNNQTVAKKHTDLMKKFHSQGTLWTSVKNIIETPLFVDSQLTSMIQVADLCAYALRRYLENNEEELFNLIFKIATKKNGKVVGVRHFTELNCCCKICSSHRP
ncbi:DUF3800 domain-containing protein [bacterium]|nr:DUF3800 domain-containing protein [bacterium]